MSDGNDQPVGDDEEQQRQQEAFERMLEKGLSESAFEKILDEVVEKYGDTLRRLGDM